MNVPNVTSERSLNAAEVQLRKDWLEFTKDDEKIITEELDELISPRVNELIDYMYEHFLAFEHTRSFFPDETVLQRAKAAQAKYFVRLTKGHYDLDYVKERLGVGSIHYRIELDPTWYIGAYNRAISMLLPILLRHFGADEGAIAPILAFLRLIFFDIGLAIESYIMAKESAIRQHRDALRELQTERRVTKSMLESAPIGIVSMSSDLICLECNDEFVQILNRADRKTVLGKNLSELAPDMRASVFDEVARTGQPIRCEADKLNLSGSGNSSEPTYWDWAAWPVKDDTGKVNTLVGMFVNVTDRVVLQQQREDFVATLTHDLKTPVLATNRAVQFLLDNDFGPITDGQREVLNTILQSNAALYKLVETLLDVYRFDSGVKELHMKDCNLANVVTRLVTEVMPLAQERGLELKASLPGDSEEIVCDEEEMRRLVQNLLDNALKYTSRGGSISVTMQQQHGKTRISVADTGKGISEEEKPKLFQRFWQAGSTGRYYASTGLGLYLCKRIAEAHNGSIWCESTLGQGSTFHFEF